MRKSLVALLSVAALLVTATPSFAFPVRGHESTTFQLTGAPAGSGTAVLTTIWKRRKICFNITASVTPATTYTATLNETAVTGLVAELFHGQASGTKKACVGPVHTGVSPDGVYSGRAELKKLIRHPALFDVKISTDTFPNGSGAMDGVLHNGSTP